MFKIYKVLIVETLTIVVKQVIEQLGENKTFVQFYIKVSGEKYKFPLKTTGYN